MRTIKYQSGGIYYTPFISQLSQTQQVQSKSSNSEDKGKQLIEKEIVSVLKENGLQNDVDYFLNAANSFLVSNSGFSDSIRNMGQSREYNIGELIKLQSYANRVKHNKEMFTLAKNQVTKEGAGSEVALTDSGEMYVLDDEGRLNIISAKAYAENQEDYRVLTNSELMNLRSNAPSLTYNDTILENLQNTVGIKSIVEYVNKTINEFGTRKRSSSPQSYVEKNKSTIEKGIEQLLGYGPEGMYKLTNSSKSEQQGYDENSKDREEQLFTAVNYLYSTLPTNMKNVLKAHTAAEGGNPNSAKDVLRLLTNAIQFNTNHAIDTDTKVDFDSTASKASGGSGSSSKEKYENLTRDQMMAYHLVTREVETTINSSDSKGGITLIANSYGKPMDTSNKQIGRQVLSDLLVKDRGLGSTGIISSISFGDQLLKESDLDRVMYDGTSNVELAYLPINKAIYAETGKIVPDLDMARRFEKFVEWYENNPTATSNKVFMKLQELDIDAHYDQARESWIPNDIKPFYILNGYASSKAIDFNDESPWLVNIDSNEGSKIFDVYERMLNYGSEEASKSHKRPIDFGRRWLTFGEDSSMYKGAIFIPQGDPAISTVVSGHEKVPEEMLFNIQNRRKLQNESRIKTQFD